MEEAILNFNKQFDFEPEIKNANKIKPHKHHILAGMGGSHLASGILKMYKPGIDLYVHRNYGLPPYEELFFKDALLIASSYSGNTEETLDFLEEGYSRGYNVSAIATGGKILEFAKKNELPYIQIPDDGIQPRAALGYSLVAMAKLTCDDGKCINELRELKDKLDPESFRKRGEELAESLSGKIPVVYSSTENLWIAYNWKIKMNETGKIPAFYNLFPEMNHNELNSFTDNEKTRSLSGNLHIIILRDDSDDHIRVKKRMEVVEGILEGKGIPVTTLRLEGDTKMEKVFNSSLLADWTALSIAKANGDDPESVAIIEDLKTRMAG